MGWGWLVTFSALLFTFLKNCVIIKLVRCLIDKLEFGEEVYNMKKVLAVILVLITIWGIIGCSGQNKITKDDIVDKVYEKDGLGSDFEIEINADGTFTYYEGWFSSHSGRGEWSYSDGVLTLFEKVNWNEGEHVVNTYIFLVEKDTLIFVDKGLGNFLYIKVNNGEKFFAK